MRHSTDPNFDEIRVSELFCRQCRQSRPVTTRLRFEIPRREYEFRCFVCELVVGSRIDDDADGF